MKYCGHCGKQLQDEVRFCTECGAQVPVTPKNTSDTEEAIAEPENHDIEAMQSETPPMSLDAPWEEPTESDAASGISEQPQKKGIGKLLKIFIGSLLVILIVTGGFFGWKNFGTEAREQEKLDLAVKYLSENDYERAILAFNDAIEIDPREVKAYGGLARVYTLQGKYDDAKSIYEKGLTAVNSDQKQALQLALAGMYIDQGQLDDAEEALSGIKSQDPSCIEAYIGLGMVFEQKGDYNRAKAILEEAIDKEPQAYRTYNELALFCIRNDSKEEAFDYLARSLSREIDQQDAYYIISDLYKDNWTELRDKAVGVSDQQVGSMLEFYSYYAAQDFQQAINIFNDKLARQTENQKAQVSTAIAMNNMNHREDAREIIDQLLKEQINEGILCDVAAYYLGVGDTEKAREYILKSLGANGTNLEPILVLKSLNASDEDIKIYTVRMLLFNWEPLGYLSEQLRAKSLPVLGDFGNINSIFEKIEESSNLKVNINQIDNQQFPIMKLYVSVQDYDSESIDNIPFNYFIIREKLLNSNSYIAQKANSVTQLEQNASLTIDLVMDTSGSMHEYNKLENAQQAATNFIKIVNGSDEIGIVEFNSYVRTKTEFTKNTAELTDAISQLYTSGQTALYDALYTALLQTSQKDGAKCIVAFTDGMSNKDTKTKQDVIDLAKKTGIPIYTIGIGSDIHTNTLDDIARQTGGYYVSTPTAADLENIYNNIFREQKKQYLIIYRTNNPEQDKKWRNIEVGVYGTDFKGMADKDYNSEVVKPPLASYNIEQINEIIKDKAGNGSYSIIIKDLSTGLQSKAGEYDKKMPASALINIPITLAIADMIKNGETTLDAEIPYHYTVDGRRKYTPDYDGQMLTVGELLQAMLNYSDNNCTNSLLDYIGIDKVNNIAHSYGCTNTTILHPILEQESTTENLTTCSDVEKMLELLYSDSLPIGSIYMNENFKIVDETKRVGALKNLPEGIFALHHNAMTSTKYNETAYIGIGSKKYIITVMSCNGKLENLEETTALISKYVYDQMLND